mmetsp:Transcript_20008/g.31710  ORF Transcript_20008/g.31710 Transcript_20008/m.31710 type:complete len:210 (-) Transcript_20008:4163-4792(-)
MQPLTASLRLLQVSLKLARRKKQNQRRLSHTRTLTSRPASNASSWRCVVKSSSCVWRSFSSSPPACHQTPRPSLRASLAEKLRKPPRSSLPPAFTSPGRSLHSTARLPCWFIVRSLQSPRKRLQPSQQSYRAACRPKDKCHRFLRCLSPHSQGSTPICPGAEPSSRRRRLPVRESRSYGNGSIVSGDGSNGTRWRTQRRRAPGTRLEMK